MTEPLFELQASTVDSALILAVVGEIDLATAPQLRDALNEARGVARVVVDLSSVTFIDSSGLNVLVHGQRELARAEISLRVVSPSDQTVYRVFELTRLTSQLGIVETREDALG
jgi:anti-anti-sigma factor